MPQAARGAKPRVPQEIAERRAATTLEGLQGAASVAAFTREATSTVLFGKPLSPNMSHATSNDDAPAAAGTRVT